GGFTSYTEAELADQLGGWVHGQGIPRVKMKVGTAWGSRPERDMDRAEVARDAIGPDAELFIDANGGYTQKQAVRLASRYSDLGVTWFEEPVSSDDMAGLHEIRGLVAPDVAAGEYGYDLAYFQRMCAAGAVDVVQADVSRCAGITEWLRVAAVAAGHGLQVSGHCAQSLHAHVACAVPNIRHLEYFHDHARVDRLLLDGVLDPDGGVLRPDLTRPGLGLELKVADAAPYRRAG
ncbi:MAG: mandelate racemase, partial [Actinomycetota bacterium]|nr:mandelate racemase [Actinomycetota bacterium]